MRINTTQRVIILSGMAVIVLMGLYPPWTYTFKSSITYSEQPAGYGFIASPPRTIADSLMHGAKMDMSRLLIQWAVTIAASCAGVLVTAKRKDEQNS
jgi:hypothetical protein